MADEEVKRSEATGRYKLVGAKGSGERVDRVLLEGTSTNPVRYLDLGTEIDLTEEEAEEIRSRHQVNLRKVGDSEREITESSSKAAQQAAQAATAGVPESTGTGKTPRSNPKT
jgi:hypothetical protein